MEAEDHYRDHQQGDGITDQNGRQEVAKVAFVLVGILTAGDGGCQPDPQEDQERFNVMGKVEAPGGRLDPDEKEETGCQDKDIDDVKDDDPVADRSFPRFCLLFRVHFLH